MPKLTFTEQKTITREIEYSPCLKCHSTDIKFFDYGYSEGNSGGGECKKCKRSCTGRMSWNSTKEEQVNIWNSQNDPSVLIAKQLKVIIEARIMISNIVEMAEINMPEPNAWMVKSEKLLYPFTTRQEADDFVESLCLDDDTAVEIKPLYY